MFRDLITALFFLAFTANTAYGQELEQTQRQEALVTKSGKATIVPRDIILPVVVHQPDCPLKLEFAKVHAYLDGGGAELFRFRNQGSRPIKGYRIAWLFLGGTGGSIGQGATDEEEGWIRPGEILGAEDIDGDPYHAEMIPFTDGLKKPLDLEGGMKSVLYFMVVRVEFSDGTVFDDSKAYEALKAHLERLDK